MDKHAKNIKKLLIFKRKVIREKLNLLKKGEYIQQDTFSPITKYLKNIEEKICVGSAKVKEDNEKHNIPKPISYTKKLKRKKVIAKPKLKKKCFRINQNEDVFEHDPTAYDLTDEQVEKYAIDDENEVSDLVERSMSPEPHATTQINPQALTDYLEQYHPLPRKYIAEMLNDSDDLFDKKYGIRHNIIDESFHMGDSRIFFHDADIYLKHKRYKGTPGLYELLFKKSPLPQLFNSDDLKNYKEIILKTNAHKRYYQNNQQIDGSRLPKYRQIIAPLVTKKSVHAESVGAGVTLQKQVTNKPTDLVYWNDVNELVDRLRLLIASQQAGNNSHINEIVSIIEELKEAKIIQ